MIEPTGLPDPQRVLVRGVDMTFGEIFEVVAKFSVAALCFWAIIGFFALCIHGHVQATF